MKTYRKGDIVMVVDNGNKELGGSGKGMPHFFGMGFICKVQWAALNGISLKGCDEDDNVVYYQTLDKNQIELLQRG